MTKREHKDVALPDGSIAGLELDAVADTQIEVYDAGTKVVLVFMATDGSMRWEQEMEVDEVDQVLVALKKSRDIAARRKYGA
jgi:hypothetical protein